MDLQYFPDDRWTSLSGESSDYKFRTLSPQIYTKHKKKDMKEVT
jgi:hypothetical protein